jgi:peptidoglycan/LPS O-acetylase OafA/YrhL
MNTIREIIISLDEKMRQSNDRPTGFDYIRLILSIMIIFWHSFGISDAAATLDNLPKILTAPAKSLLICYFSLSGFLVAYSLHRCQTLISFFGFRLARIVPALIAQVTLTALVVGPLLTSVPLEKYFLSAEFRSYFLNIVGIMHFTLPGVFENNPIKSNVSGHLWTIPWEVYGYISLGALSILGARKNRIILLFFVVLLQILIAKKGFCSPPSLNDFISGEVLLFSFLFGVLIHSYREKIPASSTLAAISLLACAILLPLQKGSYLAPAFVSYLTIFLGSFNPQKLWPIKDKDLSYGYYIYGFVIQQIIASLDSNAHHWQYNFILAISFGFFISYASWQLVEKPVLIRKSIIISFENKYTTYINKILKQLNNR